MGLIIFVVNLHFSAPRVLQTIKLGLFPSRNAVRAISPAILKRLIYFQVLTTNNLLIFTLQNPQFHRKIQSLQTLHVIHKPRSVKKKKQKWIAFWLILMNS